MAESENKRTRRTPQERAAEVDEKIAKIDQSIKELESKKESVVAEYDAKITAARERIKSLEAKKQEILAPKPPRKPRKTKKQKIQEIVKLAMKNGMSLLLCSDGFRHEVSEQEIYEMLKPAAAVDGQNMHDRLEQLIRLSMQRGERDNITAALIKAQ